MMQTEPNKWPHTSGMRRTAKECHGIIDLDVVRHSQSFPYGPEPVQNVLAGFGERRMEPATDSCCIDDVKAVEAKRPFQIAGADQISLMALVWQ